MEITPDLLLQAYRIGVFPMGERRDDPKLYWLDPRLRAVLPLDGFHLSHASRELRALAARGRSLRYLVPSAVAEYIKSSGLYLDRPELVLKRPFEPDDLPVDPAT